VLQAARNLRRLGSAARRGLKTCLCVGRGRMRRIACCAVWCGVVMLVGSRAVDLTVVRAAAD
jgi:hypothetical protein